APTIKAAAIVSLLRLAIEYPPNSSSEIARTLEYRRQLAAELAVPISGSQIGSVVGTVEANRMMKALPNRVGAVTHAGTATWRSGYAAVCKTVYPGSIPGVASNPSINLPFRPVGLF